MKTKLNAKGKLLNVAKGKLKYHMSQNAMVSAYSKAYVSFLPPQHHYVNT